METMETTAFEQMILKLRLVNESQLAEIHEEIGDGTDLQPLIAALERKSFLTPWQVGKVLKGDIDGFILGGYKLLYKIRSGSFGRVYRAVDSRDGTVVAVKVLRRRWSENEQRIEMFIREGKVGLMLKHPNIVEVLAISRDSASAQYYIVMEFVEGGNLMEILQIRKTLNVAESLRIVEDCANGLTYAFSKGMTHRDVKLTNILISDTGEAKLVDFGLAQFFSTFAQTEEEKVDRTVDYAGLERATEVKMGDVRSDGYFLGCVLYECLTGRPPLIVTRDKHARMRKGRFEEVRPIHPNEFNGPPSVLMLVETMMAMDPKARYQTPSQMLDAIRRVRREVEGRSGNGDDRPLARSVYLAEPDERLQDVLRDKLNEQGYRVFLAGDPLRALERFHKQPFDGLIVDARTTGEEGFRVFEHIVDEAGRRRLRCAALLLLDEEQADWEARVPTGPHVAVMIQDISFKTVSRKLKELMGAAHDSEDVPELVRPAPLPPPAPPPLELPPLELPPPVPHVVEDPSPEEMIELPAPAPRIIEISPRKKTAKAPRAPAARILEIPPREETTPPPRRREPAVPAISPSPPREKTPPPPPRREPVVPAISSSPPREKIPPPPPRREPAIPSAVSSSPPREKTPPPQPRREPVVPAISPSPPREETPPPPPRREPTASALSPHLEDDFPMLAHEEGSLLPPPEAAVPPPPPRKEATPPPQRKQNVIPPRRMDPRKKRELEPVMQHITHEDPLAPPDVHHWRDELGVPEKKEGKGKVSTRLRKYWESVTPKQKSIAGLALLALVIVLFFTSMISDLLINNKIDKIPDEASVEEVVAIMGGPGEIIDLNPQHRGIKDRNVIRPETRKWEVGNRTIVITFSNGRMLMKQIQEK